MYDATETGKRIKNLRAGVPQDKCAHDLGISRGALSYYENGERKPDAEVLFRMSRHFNVSVDYLLGLTDTPSVDADVQNACKITGLNEVVINHMKFLSDFLDEQYFHTILQLIILGLDHSILFLVEDYYITVSRTEHCKQYLIKEFCKLNGLNIPENVIDERGIHAIDDLLQRAACQGIIESALVRLSLDTDYKKYKITQILQNMFLSIEDMLFSEEIEKKAAKFIQSDEAICLKAIDNAASLKAKREAVKIGKHNPTKE